MCVNCGNSSCSSCNENSMVPSTTSALKYDGEKFNCPGKFTYRPGDNINDIINKLAEQVCTNANQGGGGGGGVYVETSRILTVSEIENLHVTPIELLPAVNGTAYQVERVLLKGINNGTDYISTITGDNKILISATGPGSYDIIKYLGNDAILWYLNTFMAPGSTVFGVDCIDANFAGVYTDPWPDFSDNRNLQISIVDGSVSGGNHELEVIVIYKEITL